MHYGHGWKPRLDRTMRCGSSLPGSPGVGGSKKAE
jgi:hypothetical protein